jgi:FAD dependent oxidoreductase.
MLYDKIIIGAGIYGLYAAEQCGRKGEKILVLEYDDEAFKRATYINQARVHMGYHYPRSFSTAIKSANYFERFNQDYNFCINSEFDQIYATSSKFSWTNASQFKKFCESAEIRCDEIAPGRYFKAGLCDGAFLTKEYTYDAHILRDHFLDKLKKLNNVDIKYKVKLLDIEKLDNSYRIKTFENEGGRGEYLSDFILNATYASVNQVLKFLDFEPFKIKYELCEIILCDVADSLRDVGLTVMDGPFFSIMPFGKTGLHSLTSVTFTPHVTSYDVFPTFDCQLNSGGFCSANQLGNCNECNAKPESAWSYMSTLAKKYMKEEYGFSYKKSLFSMKPILKASEIDDSRPTVIKQFSVNPTFISVLSGKINTVYDLDEVL